MRDGSRQPAAESWVLTFALLSALSSPYLCPIRLP